MESSTQSSRYLPVAVASLLLLLLLLLLLTSLLWKLLLTTWWNCLRIQHQFQSQGVRGPPHRFFYGNLPELIAMGTQARSAPMPQISHNILPRLFPHHLKWSQIYGQPYLYWIGNRPRLVVSNPDLLRDILSSKAGHYHKAEARPDINDLLGGGLANLEGEKWAQQRRIVNPAFFVDNLKSMVPTIAACAASMLDNWQNHLNQRGSSCREIDAHSEMVALTADIIAHTAFGSNYAEGKQVFELQHELQVLFEKSAGSMYIPGVRILPTATNQYRWKLNKQIRQRMHHIIQNRMDQDKAGVNLLGQMLAANKKELQGNRQNLSMSIQEIIDECKFFFFAGHETTANWLTWTIMLLAIHSDWQQEAREEVLAICGKQIPEAESLNCLKTVGMVLNESLRLYPPAPQILRQTIKDMKLDNLRVPQGTVVAIPILALHHDPELWGPDATEFNPRRFVDGVRNACKHPMAFFPFSIGPRNCVGQNFAVTEARTVLAMILQHFCFHLSPAYKHAPTNAITLYPLHGVQIVLEKIN